jgi:hypothetical protein
MAGRFEALGPAGVDHDGPAAGDEALGQGEAQAL